MQESRDKTSTRRIDTKLEGTEQDLIAACGWRSAKEQNQDKGQPQQAAPMDVRGHAEALARTKLRGDHALGYPVEARVRTNIQNLLMEREQIPPPRGSMQVVYALMDKAHNTPTSWNSDLRSLAYAEKALAIKANHQQD